jgi:phage gp45-like
MMRDFYDSSLTFRARLVGIDDSGDQQLLDFEGFAGERFTKVARASFHGFSSNPPIGSVGWVQRIGSSDRLQALGFENTSRPRNTVSGGGVLHDEFGNIIYAKMAGGIEARVVNGKFEVDVQGMKIIATAARIDLGGPGGFAVETVAGPSSKVFAIL